MEKTITVQLSEVVGAEDVSASPLERRLYSHDAAPIPRLLLQLFKTLPELIVRPESVGEVAQILRIASAHKSPVVPRAAGSWSLGGVTPVKGGIVLDLVKLNRIGELSADGSWVEVDAGVVWQDLTKHLLEKGLTVFSYPTSAPSSTVGGWVSTGGFGIGSLNHGHIGEQIEAVEVVTPTGDILPIAKDAADPKIEWFFGTEGQFGVITKVRLRIRKTPAESSVRGVYVPGHNELTDLIDEFVKLGKVIYSLKVLDSGLVALRSALGTREKEDGNFILVVFEGTREEVSCASSAFDQIVIQRGLQPCDDDLAEAEWQERYCPMRIGRLGPTVLGGETIVPIEQLESVLREMGSLGEKYGAQIGIEAHAISKGLVLVLAMYLADERRTLRYITRLALIRDIIRIGLSHGGKPYGIGLWNSVYIKHVLGKDYLEKLERVKKRFDPEGIMNPGKFFKAETRIGIPLTTVPYAALMNILSMAHRFQ